MTMQCAAKCAVSWSHQRWWSTVQSFNVSVFNICVNECNKIFLLDKMAGKINTKSTTKPAVRGRPRKNAKTVQIEENTINPTTAQNEKPNDDIESVQIDESSNNSQGINKFHLEITEFEFISNISIQGVQNHLQIMESPDISTNKTTTTNQRRKRQSENINDRHEISTTQAASVIDHSDIDYLVPPKKTRSNTVRKPKFRPEDERTMKILAEKFQLAQNGEMQCQVNECRSSLKCTKPSNLKRHISQVHPTVYSELFPNEVSSQIRDELDAYNSEQDAIELVTVNGYPFSVLNASGMRGFLQCRLDPLRYHGHPVEINRQSIAKKVAESSEIIRNRIKKELNGKTVSVMFDVCTISTLSTFGVNVTYMENSKVVCRSLGIIKIEERHTAVNLADMLFDLLAKFNIPLTKVFSITTDTAKNATNTTHVLNAIMANSNDSTDVFLDIEPDDDLEFEFDQQNEIELQAIIDKANSHTLLAEETAETVARKNSSIKLINQINCSAHVLQLAINSSLAESDSSSLIEKVKKMCLLMRTQVVMIAIRKLGSKMILPPLDNTTRWNSKFLMVSFVTNRKLENLNSDNLTNNISVFFNLVSRFSEN